MPLNTCKHNNSIDFVDEEEVMLQIKDTIVSLDIVEKFFLCDLDACLGECCIEGDAGAPITQEEYDTLSKIAPVVAYPRVAWQTYWREQVTINAEAMGMKDEGEALVKETEQLIANKLKEYPQIEGKSGAFLWVNPADTSSFYVYLTSDPRASYLTDLGLSFPENIKEMGKDETTFSLTVSAENADILNNVDILVTYGDDTTLKALQKDAIFGKIPAIKRGSVVVIDSNSALAGSATPTVLGISATIDEYLSLIGQAADKVNE